jgi:hypothetical protein
MDRGNRGGGGEEAAILVAFGQSGRESGDGIVTFQRRELDQLLGTYCRMVAAGEWRDYAIDYLRDSAIFSVYRRTHDMPLFRIVKDPKLSRRQGAYSVVSASGQIVRRGHELSRVLGFFENRPRLVKA